MLRAMIRSVASSALLVLLTASLGTSLLACKKDKKDDGAAAVDAPEAAAPVEVAVADAAPEPVADAADDAADAAVEPLDGGDSGPAPKAVRKAPADPPICVAARSAKKRGSPAAASLAAQCKAAGGKP